MTFQTFDRSDVVTWPDKKKATNLYLSRIYVFRLPFHWIQCACKDLIIDRGLRKDNKIHNHEAERVQVRRPTLSTEVLAAEPDYCSHYWGRSWCWAPPKNCKKITLPKKLPLELFCLRFGRGSSRLGHNPNFAEEEETNYWCAATVHPTHYLFLEHKNCSNYWHWKMPLSLFLLNTYQYLYQLDS